MPEIQCNVCGQSYDTDKSAHCPNCAGSPQTAPPRTQPRQNAQATGALSTSGMAITAMVFGLLGLCIPLIGVVGLVLGIIAINQIDDPQNRLTGRGMAMTGAILGGVGLVVGFIIPLLIGILLPALGAARNTARQMQNNTQIRGIHQGMVIYAQGNKTGGGDGQYPGLNRSGGLQDGRVAPRFKLMLDQNLFTPDYAISPAENGNKQPWTSGPFTHKHYSYSMLSIDQPGGRRAEWSETLNGMAIVLTDRNTGANATQSASSPWTTQNSGDWRGGMAWNDNHVTFETDQVADTEYLLPATNGANYNTSRAVNKDDNILEATGTDDAHMIHQGQ